MWAKCAACNGMVADWDGHYASHYRGPGVASEWCRNSDKKIPKSARREPSNSEERGMWNDTRGDSAE